MSDKILKYYTEFGIRCRKFRLLFFAQLVLTLVAAVIGAAMFAGDEINWDEQDKKPTVDYMIQQGIGMAVVPFGLLLSLLTFMCSKKLNKFYIHIILLLVYNYNCISKLYITPYI